MSRKRKTTRRQRQARNDVIYLLILLLIIFIATNKSKPEFKYFIIACVVLVVVCVVVFICIWIITNNKKHNDNVKNNFEKSPNSKKLAKDDYAKRKGRIGEQLIRKRLQPFINDSAEILYNCYIPNDKGGTSEIDVLMISKKGIWVIESKNYSGWLFGKADDQYWTQSVKDRNKNAKKSKFYNPIIQNRGHIKHLQNYLEMNVPFVSVVVFADKCVFKNLTIDTDEAEVIHLNDLQYCILKKMEQMPEVISVDLIGELKEKIYSTTQVTDEIKEKHIQNIKVSNAQNATMNTNESACAVQKEEKMSMQVEALHEDVAIDTIEKDCNEENIGLTPPDKEMAELLSKYEDEDKKAEGSEKEIDADDVSESVEAEGAVNVAVGKVDSDTAPSEIAPSEIADTDIISVEKEGACESAAEIKTEETIVKCVGAEQPIVVQDRQIKRIPPKVEKKETPKNMKITYCPKCHATMVPKTIEEAGELVQILECYRYPKCKHRENL